MDADDFKGINDTLGHDAGDRLLEEMAKRLRSMLREKDLVARLGGDEFAVVVPGMADQGDVAALGRRILNQMRRPFDYCERTVVIRVSLGVALYPDHDRTPAELLKDADMALYSAKAEGGNRAAFYSPEMRRAIERRVRTAGEIRQALDRGEIVPHYQPKVCLSTGRIEGFEALARWRHPTRGLLSPSAFASAFEDRELSSAIGECMIRAVISDLREWRGRGVPPLRIAVNLSAAELRDADLAGRLLGMLAEADIRSDMLEVEITESVVFGPGADLVEATLQQLHQAGVTTALDDFGTGHASLTHLKQFPIDNIKIDRSFIRDVLDDADDAAIVSAVIGLGQNLGMKLIAEGVETAAQADFLVARGCDFGQGYLFARPMPAENVPSFTAAHRLDEQAELLFFLPRSVA
jgi:diguanylate cyclase (GGDEF)-like protein